MNSKKYTKTNKKTIITRTKKLNSKSKKKSTKSKPINTIYIDTKYINNDIFAYFTDLFYKKEEVFDYKSLNNMSIEKIVNLHKSGAIPYPIKRYITSISTIKNRFDNLKYFEYNLIKKRYSLRYKPQIPNIFFEFRPFNGYEPTHTLLAFFNESETKHSTSELFKEDNYIKYDLISDYFQEEHRLKCRRHRQQLTPYDYFLNTNNFKNTIIQCKKKYGMINGHTLRETLYYNFQDECSSFRPTVMIAIIKMFNSKRLLDISAGWGDRLIGAIAGDVDYYFACDPNPDLHKGYKEIIQTFGSYSDVNKFKVIESPFEDVKIEMPPGVDKDGNLLKFDLVMTSPPYFDLEIYTDKPGQSVLGKNKDEWLKKFMYPSLKKAWNALGDNGILALNINNKNNNPIDDYTGEIIKYVNAFDDSDFHGCLSYSQFYEHKGEFKNPQPIWIWRKLKSIDNAYKKQNFISNYNPTMIIKKEKITDPQDKTKKITLNILRNDLLQCCFDQRALIPYIEKDKHKEYVYAGSLIGDFAYMLAYSSLYNKKRLTFFAQTLDNEKKQDDILTNKLLDLNADVYSYKNVRITNFLNLISKKYIEWKQIEKGKDYIKFIKLMNSEIDYIRLLAKQLKKSLPEKLFKNPPKRIWIMTSTGVIVNALYLLFPKDKYPDMKFMLVTLFPILDERTIEYGARTTIFNSHDITFWGIKENVIPPYNSGNYDSRMWNFILKLAENDDYVLNRVGDIYY